MDEYFNDYEDDFQESHHFSHFLLDDQQIDRKIELQHERILNYDLKFDKNQELGTNYSTGNLKEQIKQTSQKQIPTLKLIKKQRKIRKIQTTSKIEIKNQFTFSGSKNDTVELNTNFKTLFKKFLRQNHSPQLMDYDIFFDQFEKSVSSFKAFSKLFNSNQKIKQLCTKFIRSSSIVKKILNSRAKFWMRLQMIKYIQALSRNTQSEKYVRWKSIRKQNV